MKSPKIPLPPTGPSLQSGKPGLNFKKRAVEKYRYKATSTPIKIKVAEQLDSALAHEVRNPLATINLSIEMLRSAIKERDLNTYLDIILRSSKRINDLIDELLKHKQTDKVIFVEYSIHQLLEEVLDVAKDRIGLKNIVVTKEFLPQDCLIVSDKTRMKIALTNIVMNAIDAITLASPEKGELKLCTKFLHGKYLIEIGDNGCGMNVKDIQHIFKPYFTNKPGGLGLGLSTTYEILQENHFKVKVESEKGKGTRFILSLSTACKQPTITYKS